MSNLLENQLSSHRSVSSSVTQGDNEYEDMGSLLAGEASGFRALRRNQIMKGTVVSVDEESVLVHVGTKSEGLIPREEMAEEGEELPDLKYEQEIYVQVLEPDSPRGPILSLKRARREQSWEDMEDLVQSGRTLTAKVIDHNRGGALLDVRGLRGFAPISQLVSLPPSPEPRDSAEDTSARLEQLRGQMLTVKVIQADRGQNRLILSERAAADEVRAQRRQELLTDLRPGQIRRGTVRNVTNFGAFIDLGGADGLVHVSEMSYERIQEPKQVLRTGQEVDVFVLEVRPEDHRISLSLKRAMADPWSTVIERYQPGQIVDATITRLMKFGAFAQVEPGVEGLIHVSELADSTPRDPGHVVQTGQTVQTKIIHIDQPGKRLGLSIRQVRPAEAETEMSAQQWHAEQALQSDPMPSAFHALSSMVHDLPAEAPENIETPPVTRDEENDTTGDVAAAPSVAPDEGSSTTNDSPIIANVSDASEQAQEEEAVSSINGHRDTDTEIEVQEEFSPATKGGFEDDTPDATHSKEYSEVHDALPQSV